MSKFVTFIIPTIGRNTLEKAIQSIEAQTNSEWKIIVIFDGIKSTLNNSNPKMRILEIEKKGIDKNSAGNVRNHGMKYADTEWIAFLDDDDAISPDFVETFYKEIHEYPFVDVLIFRMMSDNVIIPKPKTDNFYEGDVGISFIINKKILDHVQFVPSGVEDYNFLNKVREKKFVIMISPYVKYFVREIKDVNKHNIVGERVFINSLKESFAENDNTFKCTKSIFIIFFLLLLLFLYFLFVNNKRFYKFIKRTKYLYFYIITFIIFIIFIIVNIYSKFKKRNYQENFTNNNIYVFWTGDNEMNENRLNSMEKLKEISKCNVILVTQKNLEKYILPSVPLHPSYEYLSFTHKADYLRTYFMNFYGGGYSDIKCTTDSWKSSFDELNNNNDFWINGYTEIEGGVSYEPLKNNFNELIGNCCYICKPQTLLTTEWYNSMISLLDEKLEKLKEFPATFPQDCLEVSNGKYPIKWTEMLGDIFHKVCYKYKEKILHTLPISIFENYR